MNYQITCQCGKKLVVSRSQAGQQIDCTCGLKVSIPTLRGLSSLPLVDDPESDRPSATRTQVAESTWKGWRGILISFLVAVGIVSSAMGTMFILQRYQVDTSYTEDAERNAGDEMIDKMGVEDLLSMFDEFRGQGLGLKSSPPFQIIQTYAKDRRQYAFTCAVIAALSAISTIAILLIRPRKR